MTPWFKKAWEHLRADYHKFCDDYHSATCTSGRVPDDWKPPVEDLKYFERIKAMTPDAPAVREVAFWIDEHAERYVSLEDCKPDHGAFLKVVCYSDYAQLQKDLDNLRNQFHQTRVLGDADIEIIKLRKELEKLKGETTTAYMLGYEKAKDDSQTELNSLRERNKWLENALKIYQASDD